MSIGSPYSYVKVPNTHARTIVVGDIHGCFNEFMDLLEKVNYKPEDLVVTVGDMIDRGPKSWKTCEFFRDTKNAHCVLGNHERRLAGSVRGTSQPAWSQKQTLSMLEKEQWELWAEYLETLPAVIETCHTIITHARLDPSRDLQNQDPRHTCAVGGDRVRIECNDQGIPLWFSVMDLDKPVCMGHVGYERVDLVPGRLYALDTKAVRGGPLTGVVFPDGKIVSVQSRQDYYSIAFNAWQRQIDEWGDVNDWPIHRAIDLLKAALTESDKDLAKKREELVAVIDELDIEKWASQMKPQLIQCFGQIPEPGQARGQYYMAVRNMFESPIDGSLAARILSNRVRNICDIANIVRKGTIASIADAMKSLSAKIQRS